MRNRFTMLLAAAVLIGCAVRSNAQFVTFATQGGNNVFTETSSPGNPPVGQPFYTIGGGGIGVFSILPGTIYYAPYAAALGIGGGAEIDLTATLTTATAGSNTPATVNPNGEFSQPIGPVAGGNPFSWQITLNNATGGVAAGTVLLSGSAFSTRILGVIGGTNHTLISTDSLNEGVTLGSGIAGVQALLNAAVWHSWQFGATNRDPVNGTVAATGFLNAGRGTYTGSFAAQAAVPEPGTLSLLFGSGIGGSLLMLRRRRRA